jgi:preprotein translocase subunit SecA
MEAEEIKDSIVAIREEVIETLVDQYIPPGSLDEQWDPAGLTQAFDHEFLLALDVARWIKDDPKMNEDAIRERSVIEANDAYAAKEKSIGSPLMRLVEKEIMLKQLDLAWKEHLAAMDYLRQGIGLRGYAQKNPKQEYKREAFEMFGEMLERVKHDTISILSRVRIQSEEDVARMERERRVAKAMEFKHAEPSALGQEGQSPAQLGAGRGPSSPSVSQQTPFVRDERKVGRNEPCPCGSGKKFKQCHGRLT